MSGDYEIYDGASYPVGEPPPTPPIPPPTTWQVLVELPHHATPTKATVQPRRFPDREAALAAAEQAACTFVPKSPITLPGREVYEDGRDGYLVLFRGEWGEQVQMSVRVVRRRGDG